MVFIARVEDAYLSAEGRREGAAAATGIAFFRTTTSSYILPLMRTLACALLLTTTLTAQTPQSGREALTTQLNTIAAKQTAARRATIAQLHTRAQAEARQHAVRARLITLLGGPWPEHSPLNARITGASDHEGIHVERLLFESQPNFFVTALLYLPQPPLTTHNVQRTTPKPAILMAPGHSPSGKAGDAATALTFAHAGFVVLSYDPIGQGERLQYPNPADPTHTLLKGPTGEHGEAGLQPTLIGDAVSRYFLIDAIRATDYLLTRPEVDPHRIGAFGCSGGGLMTALTAALDTRISAAGVACFTTSFDTLLPTLGPQDSEQSIPNFIASGLDFPDWSELFAPKPYAIIATTEDMFPFAGAQSTEHEARAFYTLFNASDNLAFITGPGHHGHLAPILPRILNFFVNALHADPDPRAKAILAHATDPIVDDPKARAPIGLPPADTTVTWNGGQVSTTFPYAETIYTLNLKRAAEKPLSSRSAAERSASSTTNLAHLQQEVRTVTHATTQHTNVTVEHLDHTMMTRPADPATMQAPHPKNVVPQSSYIYDTTLLSMKSADATLPALELRPHLEGNHGETVLLLEDKLPTTATLEAAHDSRAVALTQQGNFVLLFTPRPSPAGDEETKSPLLGPFYLTELRAELTGNTLMGLRIDDMIHAIDYLAHNPVVDPANITAEASGHLALVLLHAAILDPRLKHITLHALPASYTDLLHTAIPQDAPQDILPGVLLHYDTPDLIRALGSRVTVVP